MRELFATELSRVHERSKTELVNNGTKAEFRITAQDVAALRAAANTITSVLAMHEKTARLLND